MLTEDESLIRAQDIPERIQLATSPLSQSSTLSLHQNLTESDVDDSAAWAICAEDQRFFSPTGPYNAYSEAPVLAVSYAPHFLFVYEFEVPTSGLMRGIAYHISILKKCAPASNLSVLLSCGEFMLWARSIACSWNGRMRFPLHTLV